MTYAIAAAGTGGHVYPALTVAGALEDLGVTRDQIVFLGGDRFEARAVPEAGYRFRAFRLTRLQRAVSLENVRIPVVVRRTAADMAALLRDAGTRLVIGMGGYVTIPASLAARRVRLPFFLQEQNASPGLASRFAARRAQATYLGLPGRSERLPRSEVVGNPIRPSLARIDRAGLREEGRRRYGVGGAGKVLGILGGSLGARVLNEAAPILARDAGADAVIHLTGADAYPDMSRLAAGAAVPWSCRAFEAEMHYFYAAADLVVCRAGAMTVSELAATGTPAVLVPLERVGQHWNAGALADTGGARVVPQGEIGLLPRIVRGLLADRAALERMGQSARKVGRPDAAMVIARRLREAAGD